MSGRHPRAEQWADIVTHDEIFGNASVNDKSKITLISPYGGVENSGLRLLSRATIDRAIEEQFNGIDLVMGVPIRWGLGFGLANEQLPYLNPRAFYWGGFGGSWLEMDPDARMCFSYVMNELEVDPDGDRRMIALRNALYSAMQ